MVIKKRELQQRGPSEGNHTKQPKTISLKKIVSFKKDLSRFVKWPKYIKIQRQRRVFCQKLKIPPAIFQFTKTLDKNMTNQVFQLLFNYKKKELNQKTKSFKKDLENQKSQNSMMIKHGINTVSKLVKNKKSLFVLIANDVNPIDCVVWMPTLCAKMGVPYCIVKNKSRLGTLVNRKTTSCIALTYMDSKNNEDLEKLIDCFKQNFNQRYSDAIKRWGEGKS